jgi:hypothetical protein
LRAYGPIIVKRQFLVYKNLRIGIKLEFILSSNPLDCNNLEASSGDSLSGPFFEPPLEQYLDWHYV